MLIAIIISDHLRASGVVDVELNESSRISARLTRKGFRILEVRLARRFFITNIEGGAPEDWHCPPFSWILLKSNLPCYICRFMDCVEHLARFDTVADSIKPGHLT